MKPHLPLPLLRAVLACFAALTTAPFTTTAAEPTIPDGYAKVYIDNAADIEAYSRYKGSEYAFLLTGDTPLTLTPTNCTWWATRGKLFTGKNYFFASQNTGNKISLTFDGGTDGPLVAFSDAGTLEFQGLSDVKFLNLYRKPTTSGSEAKGGAIYASFSSSLTFSGNRDISFSGNYASATSDASGGAICAYPSSLTFMTFSGNRDISFSGNYAYSEADYARGGAIYASSSSLTFSGNRDISFSGNYATSATDYASASGGAIYADSSSPLTFDGNGNITFSENYATSAADYAYARGGAIYADSSSPLTFDGNGNITFSENYATSAADYASARGGAIAASSLTFSGNRDISFSGNYASAPDYAKGGAIIANTLTFSENGDISFSGNYATSSADSARGGAIAASSLTFSGNGIVTFRDNYVRKDSGNSYAYGGAISQISGSTFILRGAALFERNYEVEEGVYRLRSVYQESNSDKPSTMELSAPTGKSITFRDGVYADSNVTVTLNKDYEVDSVTQKADGDILFSGATMAADLAAIKGSAPTDAELSNSLTSELAGSVTLYGGRLRIEDGVKLTVGSFSTATGSNATLLLKEASVTGYSSTSTLSLSSGSTLDLQGVNTITAQRLTMAGGTTMAFTLSSENTETAVLTLGATLSTDTLTLDLAGENLVSGTYKLITLQKPSTQYDYTQWTSAKITVSGLDASFNDLSWDTAAGTLYLTYTGLPVLTTATWSNGSTDGLWNTSSKNWTQDDYAYAYKDGVDVVFGDTGAGTVTLVGTLLPKSVLVDSSADYTWTGDGKLSGGMTLTKQGTGKLTIETANDYTGGTTISGGTVVVAHGSALGTGGVQLNGGTLQIAANGVTNAISSAGTSYLVVDNGYTLSLGSAVANTGKLTVTGALDVSKLTLTTEAATHVNTAGASGASGFAKTAAYSVDVITGGKPNGAGATVTHGSHTLVLGADGVARAGGVVDYSNYLLTGTDTVSVGAIRGVDGASAATVTQTGGTLTVDGSVQTTTTGGTIALQSGTLSGSISGATINATGGTLAASLTGNNNSITASNWVLKQVISNTGRLTISGSVKADALSLTTKAASHVDVVTGNSGDSGFVKAEGYSVTLVNGGNVVNNGVIVTHGSHTLTLGTDGIAHAGGAVDYSVYELASGDSVSASAVHGTAADASVKLTGGTLTADESVSVQASSGSVNLTGGTLSGNISGTSISATSGTLSASLTGSNSITANNWALKQVINNTGRLTLSGSFDASALSKTSTGETLVDVTGSEGGVSGFSKSAGYTVQVVDGGTLVLNGATVKFGTDTLTMSNNGIGSHGGGINYGKYTLAGSDAVSVKAIHAYATEAANASVTQTGGTLTVDEDVTTATSAGRIVLTAGAISGSIGGTASVEVRGSGRISGDNSYTGGTTLTAGTLTVGSAKALGTGRVSMSGGALYLGGLAVANDITAAGGTLNGAAAYTGKLTVQGGLSLGGVTKAGSVTLSSGTLRLGGQTLTSGTMTLSGGVIDFASGSSLKVTGALTLGGSTAVKFYTATAGTYELATVGSLSGNLSSLTLDGLDRSRYGWSVSGNKLLLTLLTTGSTAWDSTQDGQDMVFNGGEDVTIIGDVKPGSVVVDGDGTTTWNGPGSISGDTSVIKNGSGTLVVNNENTYTGGTILNDGKISVNHDNALGSGKITMNGGTLEMNGHDLSKNDVVVNSGCTLDAGTGGKVKTLTLDQPQKFSSLGNEYFDAATGLLTLKGSLIVNETLEVKHGVIGGPNASITAGAVSISGGTIDTKLLGTGGVTKTGSGEAKILGDQSYTGLTHVKGGTLSVYGSLRSDIKVDAGARLRLEGAFNGADMLLAQGARLVTKNGLSISGSQNLSCSGTIVGNLTLAGGTVTATPGDFLSITGTLTLASNTHLVLSGSGWGAGSYDLFQFKNLSGSTDYATFFGLTDGSIAKVGDKLVLTLTQAPSSPLSLRTLGSSEDTQNADEGSDEAATLAADTDGADDGDEGGTVIDGNDLMITLREALRRSDVGHVAIQSTWSAAAAQREFSDLLRQRRLQGGTGTAWVSMLGGHSRMSGTGGSDVNRMGGALGVELTVSESGNIGLAAGSTWSRLSPENHGRMHQNAQSVGLYGNAKLFGNATDSVWLSWDAAYGRTRTHGPVWNGSESWTQQSAVLATRATWARMIGQNTAVQGFGGLEYLALDSAKVQGERTGSVQNLRGEIGAGITHNAGRSSVYAEAALVGDMLRHNPVTTFDGIREQGLNPGRVGLKVSVGGSYRLNDTWSANAAYTLEAAEHNTQHSANIGVSYTF